MVSAMELGVVERILVIWQTRNFDGIIWLPIVWNEKTTALNVSPW